MDWLHRFIRRKTRPIPRHKARYFYDRLSVVYYMLAWTVGGIAFLTVMTSSNQTIPDEMNVHADPNEKFKPSVYKAAQRIKRTDENMGMKVINITNFSLKSIEPLEVSNVVQKFQETKDKEKRDFFGEDLVEGQQGENQSETL